MQRVMNIDDLLRVGNGILDDVMQAVDTNDYSDLGKKIRTRVNEVTDGFFSQNGQQNTARPGTQQNTARPGTQQNTARPGTQQNTARPGMQQTAARPSAQQTARIRQTPAVKSNFLLRRVGKSGPTLRTILGGLGVFAFGIPGIFSLAGLVVRGGAGPLAGLIIFGLLSAGSGLLLRRGLRDGKLVDRYYDYGRYLGGAEYVSIPAFAAQIGRKESEVRADLLDMMQKGYLPQARMDEQQKTLILTDRAYGMYRQAEESRMQREEEEAARRKEDEVKRKARESESQKTKEIREILERGNEYIRNVRNANDMIPDTDEMSAKLYRLEEIVHRIFEQVQKQPETAAGLRRFMDYYLPTTEKLLDAYVELDRQPVTGGNIAETKQEINEAMDVINDAFENLLNSMYQDMAWDISSDISVMKTMLAQDGLTKKEPLPR